MSTPGHSLVADSVSRLLHGVGVAADDFDATWSKVTQLSLETLLIAESAGGFGGTWRDLFEAQREIGRAASFLPLGEAILASRARSIAGFASLQGFGSIAFECRGSLEKSTFCGTLSNIPWGRRAAWVICMSADGRWIQLPTAPAQLFESVNLAGEPRDTLTFADTPCQLSPLQETGLRIGELGVLMRLGQISGALETALAMTTEHVRSRIQFGKPIGSFQAVQQQLAVFAGEVSAASCAARAACATLDQDCSTDVCGYVVAAAKIRANMAIGVATATAHQLHGAIGFTEEYHLHRLTRRLWSWRTELGNDRYWAARLGAYVAGRGADSLWSDVSR